MADAVPALPVVVSIRNRADLLRIRIASLAGQSVSRDPIEIVVVDDGAEDDTRSTAYAAHAKPTVQIRYVPQQHAV